MKKSVLFFVLFIFFTCYTQALTSDLKKEYSPQETVITKLSGYSLSPILDSQVEFKRKNVRIPLEYGVLRLNDTYYLWFNSPEIEGNYTVLLNNIEEVFGGIPKKENFEHNFSIRGNKTDYYIKSGPIISSENFEVEVFSNLPESIPIDVDFPERRVIDLNSGNNKIYFSVDEIYGTQNLKIKIGKYLIPAFITGKSKIMINRAALYSEPGEINVVRIIGDKGILFLIKVINRGENKIENAFIQYDKDKFTLKPDKRFTLNSGESINFNLTLKNNSENLKDSLVIKAEKESINVELPVIVNFVKNISNFSGGNSSSVNNTKITCSSVNGKICLEGYVCSGDSLESLDGLCCIGQCKIEDKNNSWVGYLILGLLTLLVLFIFFKYKKASPSSTSIESVSSKPS